MKIRVILLLMALLSAACTPDAVIDLHSGATLHFDESYGSQQVSFFSSREWTASSEASWITLSPDSGPAGEAMVSVTVTWNEPSFGPRSGGVVLRCGEAEKRIQIEQAQKDAIELASPWMETVRPQGDTLKVEIAHNIPIDAVEVDPSAASWIRPLSTKAMEHTQISFVIDCNEGFAGREGKVYVSGGGQRIEVTVTQPVYALSFSSQGKGFLNYLLRHFDSNKDGNISLGEALAVTELLDIDDAYGVKLENIELFRNVTAISCGASCYARGRLDLSALHQLRSFIGMADEIDVSGCPELEVLVTTEVSQLDLSHNPKLRGLDVGFSDSLRLDVRHNPLLERIDWYTLANEEVDLSGLSRLRHVDGHESQIKRLLLHDCPSLEWLHCAGGRSLEVLDVRGCTSLREIDVHENNLASLDLSETPHLQRLNLFFNKVAALDLSACPELDWLYCAGNRMETLDVQGCRSLRWVECTSNSFTSLDFSGCPALDSLDCSDCKPLRSLNVKGCSGLRYLHCSDGPRHLDLSGNPALEEFWCQLSLEAIDLSHNPVLREVNVSGSETITFLDLTQNPLLESVWGLYCPNLEAVYLSNAAFFSVDPTTKVYVNGERVF